MVNRRGCPFLSLIENGMADSVTRTGNGRAAAFPNSRFWCIPQMVERGGASHEGIPSPAPVNAGQGRNTGGSGANSFAVVAARKGG